MGKIALMTIAGIAEGAILGWAQWLVLCIGVHLTQNPSLKTTCAQCPQTGSLGLQ